MVFANKNRWIMKCPALKWRSLIPLLLLQVTDYAIARRIVDLHSRNEESVDRIYSVEDITRYIMFARQFKPKVCDAFLAIENVTVLTSMTVSLGY